MKTRAESLREFVADLAKEQKASLICLQTPQAEVTVRKADIEAIEVRLHVIDICLYSGRRYSLSMGSMDEATKEAARICAMIAGDWVPEVKPLEQASTVYDIHLVRFATASKLEIARVLRTLKPQMSIRDLNNLLNTVLSTGTEQTLFENVHRDKLNGFVEPLEAAGAILRIEGLD